MNANDFVQWGQLLAQKNGFKLGEHIENRTFYTDDALRAALFHAEIDGKPVILKLWDDPRPIDEPVAIKAYNNVNSSSMLRAPDILAYGIETPFKGWMLSEKLPENAQPFPLTIEGDDRVQLLRLYVEYRMTFPSEPHRPLMLIEKMDAGSYHRQRICRWFNLAQLKELELQSNLGKTVLDDAFATLYIQALDEIYRYFRGRPMQWSHGHFKSDTLLHVGDRPEYYMTEFTHTRMYPEGYELSFIVWAEHFMNEQMWSLGYSDWQQRLDQWVKDIVPYAIEVGISDAEELMKYSFIERALGTILADICATNLPIEVKISRIAYLSQYIKEELS